jgi:hypothetical protein
LLALAIPYSEGSRLLILIADYAGCNLPNRSFLCWLLIAKGPVNMSHALRNARCSVGTDCEYVTKCLCEKSLTKPRCISYS